MPGRRWSEDEDARLLARLAELRGDGGRNSDRAWQIVAKELGRSVAGCVLRWQKICPAVNARRAARSSAPSSAVRAVRPARKVLSDGPLARYSVALIGDLAAVSQGRGAYDALRAIAARHNLSQPQVTQAWHVVRVAR